MNEDTSTSFLQALGKNGARIPEEVIDVQVSHRLELLGLPAKLAVTFDVQLHLWEEQQ